jgi:hypothetical protein
MCGEGEFLLTIKGKSLSWAQIAIASTQWSGGGSNRPNQPRRIKRMIEVTPAATEQVAEYFKGKEASPIRVFLNSGG